MRKSLGLSLEGTGYEGRYVIIDIELHSEHPTERRAWFRRVGVPRLAPLLEIDFPDDGRVFEVSLDAEKAAAVMRPSARQPRWSARRRTQRFNPLQAT